MKWACLGVFSSLALAVSLASAAFSSETLPTALSHEMAINRAKQIGKVSYKIWVSLAAESKEFRGKTDIRFDLKKTAKEGGSSVFIDFEEGTIESLSLNGKARKDFSFDGHHLTFKIRDLEWGANDVEIAYTHPFSSNGYGFYRFDDPADHRIYTYTDFEPYYAHRFFPCFDQPDLKATYELTVEAPGDWQVISNTREVAVTGDKAKKTWTFPVSPIFSTYLFELAAGPYSSWKGSAKVGDEEIPTRLFARKSLAQYVDSKEWLDITRKGLDYYSILFGYPYPFKKYDQIIVPDFNAGAMENVGAITFTERYVFRAKVTQESRLRRADTILHEMAHQWFGDLVTMRWWNGLWLNESFATFMAAGAVDQGAHLPGAWLNFFVRDKEWAYWEDQLVTTHPIELPVPDTDTAESIFDGITYGKGASVLKQLSFFLGEDNFKEGLQRYFQKFAYRNTTLADFVRMLSEASSTDLGKWQRLWLQTPGVNTISTEWECAMKGGKNRISSFKLLQAGDELRPHRTEVGLYSFPKGQNKATAILSLGSQKPEPVLYSKAETPSTELIGKLCPEFVFPNEGDYDYAKIEFDPLSLKAATRHLFQIENPLTRLVVWSTLWNLVVDGKVAPQEFAETALKNLGHEKNSMILADVLKRLVSPYGAASVLRYLSSKDREKYWSRFESLIKVQLDAAAGGSDLQLVWYNAFLDVAHSRASQRTIRNLLEEKTHLKGFDLVQERRWELVDALARTDAKGKPSIQELIEKELQKDPTDMGISHSISAKASIPTPENKKKWLEKILAWPREAASIVWETPSPSLSPTAEGSAAPLPAPSASPQEERLSASKMRQAMRSFQLLGQEELTKESLELYFSFLEKISAGSPSVETEGYLADFAQNMYPSLCDPLVVQKTTDYLSKNPNQSARVLKALRIGRQQEERCIRAREKSLEKKAAKS